MIPGRVRCCVLGCRRTTKAGSFTEWVCGKHWRAVRPELKAAFTLTKRRIRKVLRYKPGHRTWWDYPAGSPDRLNAVAMWRRHDAAWKACRDDAIERAVGL